MAENKLSASISVSRRPRTDNSEELVRVITNQTSTSSLSSFTQAVKDLEGAGIVVGSSDVTIKGDQVKVQNGSTTAAMFTDGKINASLIEAVQIVTNGLQAQTIDAKSANITNLNVSGKIHASSLHLKESTSGSPLSGSFLNTGTWTMPELSSGEIVELTLFAPMITRSSIAPTLKPASGNVKFYQCSAPSTVPSSKTISPGYGVFKLIGWGGDSDTLWVVMD